MTFLLEKAKKLLDICRPETKSKIGTFCQSFKNPHNSEVLRTEMASEMYPDADAIKVECSANYCVFNENNVCSAKDIKIGNENAKYRSETQCDSFRCR